MFLQNKYRYFYYSIIDRALSREILAGYIERHHIIPRSLGGADTPDNIVALTAREHFICHWLLTKMVEGRARSKMFKALSSMLSWQSGTQDRHKVTSRTYERLRIQIKESGCNSHKGSDNGMYGKTHTEEAKLKMSKAHKGKKLTQEQCDEISRRHKGRKRPESTRIKMVETWKTNPRVFPKDTCKHCGTTATVNNINRWHNDNCRKISA